CRIRARAGSRSAGEPGAWSPEHRARARPKPDVRRGPAPARRGERSRDPLERAKRSRDGRRFRRHGSACSPLRSDAVRARPAQRDYLGSPSVAGPLLTVIVPFEPPGRSGGRSESVTTPTIPDATLYSEPLSRAEYGQGYSGAKAGLMLLP